MRRTAKLALFLWMAAVPLVAACSPAPPTATQPASPLPTLPTATPTTAPTPGSYRPLPTVTPYRQPTPQPGLFVNPDYGVSFRYPENWEATVGKEGDNALVLAGPPTGGFIVALFAFPQSDQSLEALAADALAGFTASMTDVVLLSDGAMHLGDGHEAWMTVVTANYKGDLCKFCLIEARSGGWDFVLFAFGTPARYDANQTVMADLIVGMRLEPPALPYGLQRSETLVLSGGESTNPRTYDPATTHGSGDKRVFSGLVAFDPQLNLVPDLAESWQVGGGTVYTFTLRSNARFHNGRPVTAQDVIYSWERAADPQTESDTVLTYLGDIVGVKEMREGKSKHISGLKAIDDHTLQVTIDAPKPYFLLKLTYPTAFVLDRDNVASGAEWYRRPNGTGPYRLTRWERFTLKLYERNEDYYLEPPAIPYILVRLYAGVALRLYESGEIDMAGVSSYDVARMLDPQEPLHSDLISGVDLCTEYVVFDVSQPPFDDPKVRQAFSMAVNRQQLIDVVYQGVGLPAQGLYPPGLPGYNGELQGLPYDPEQARALLAGSRYGGPEGLPAIVYTTSGEGSAVVHDVAALAQMWQQTLGVTITVENLEPNQYLDRLYAGQHGQMFDLGWCADYPDPENFADVLLHTGSAQNNGNYSNPDLDALLEQARVEPDVARRIQMYQQAEEMIVQDAPVIFIRHTISYVLVKPHILGYVLTPVDVPLERYLRIDPDKLPP